MNFIPNQTKKIALVPLLELSQLQQNRSTSNVKSDSADIFMEGASF
jgi:hypothetical protein